MSDSIKAKIDEYYKLKKQYEDKYNKAKNKILRDEDLTKKEKQIRIQQLKPLCLNCKKPGGNIFFNDGKTLRITCGNKEKPCNLNFEVNKEGLYFNSLIIQKQISNEIENNKDTLIKNKLNFLFSYISEEKIVEFLNKFKETYDVQSDVFEYVNNVIMNATDNKDKERDIKDKEAELFVQIQEFKQLLKQYEDDGKKGYLDDTLEVYVDKLVPTATELRDEKYISSRIEYNDDDGTYHLIQEPWNLKSLEVALDI
jgi:hypothetical protein